MMKYFTSRILMISPNKFRNNELTIADNSFQSKQVNNTSISDNAISEFERLKETILKKDISIHALDDDSEFDTPDAVFPNNWISFHKSHKAVLYPMYASNRRLERKSSTLEKLSNQGLNIEIIKDYSHFENDNKFLEGTGSIVLDRKNKFAYCSLSSRSNNELLQLFCSEMNYTPIVFNSTYQSKPIYHTNVMMCIANNYSIICLDSIDSEIDKQIVLKSLKDDNKEIIEISEIQLNSLMFFQTKNSRIFYLAYLKPYSLFLQEINYDFQHYCNR